MIPVSGELVGIRLWRVNEKDCSKVIIIHISKCDVARETWALSLYDSVLVSTVCPIRQRTYVIFTCFATTRRVQVHFFFSRKVDTHQISEAIRTCPSLVQDLALTTKQKFLPSPI